MAAVLVERRKIGTVTFDKPILFRDAGLQVAAWYIDYQYVPGTYPAIFEPNNLAAYVIVNVEMEIQAVYTPSLWGGVRVDTDRRWPDTSRKGERVIRPITIDAYALANFIFDGRADGTLGRISAWGGVFEIDDDVVAIPVAGRYATINRLAVL